MHSHPWNGISHDYAKDWQDTRRVVGPDVAKWLDVPPFATSFEVPKRYAAFL